MPEHYLISDQHIVSERYSRNGYERRVEGRQIIEEPSVVEVRIQVPKELHTRVSEQLGKVSQRTLLGTLYIEAAKRLGVPVASGWEADMIRQEHADQTPITMDTLDKPVKRKSASKVYMLREVYNDLGDFPCNDEPRGWDSEGLANYEPVPSERMLSAREQALADRKNIVAEQLLRLRSRRKYASIYSDRRPTKAQALAEIDLMLESLPAYISTSLEGWVGYDTLMGALKVYRSVCEAELDRLVAINKEPLLKKWREGYLRTYVRDRQASLTSMRDSAARRKRREEYQVYGKAQYPEWAGDIVDEVRAGNSVDHFVPTSGTRLNGPRQRAKHADLLRRRNIIDQHLTLADRTEKENLKYLKDHLIAFDLAFTPASELPSMKNELKRVASGEVPSKKWKKPEERPPMELPPVEMSEKDQELMGSKCSRNVMLMWRYLRGLPPLKDTNLTRGFKM